MAKTIKFNLICDGNPVRTIDDLRNNYSIEDMLAYFDNGLLHRWLEVRGYIDELNLVKGIKETAPLEITKQLIKIFEVEQDEQVVEEHIYILAYKDERDFLNGEYAKNSKKTQVVIDDYHAGYRELVMTIIENNTDMAKIKAALKEIDENYNSLFELNYRELFFAFFREAPMALFAMLMRDKMRDKYLPTEIERPEGGTLSSIEGASGLVTKVFGLTSSINNQSESTESEEVQYIMDTEIDADKRTMYGRLISLTTISKLEEIFQDTLCSYAGITDGYWKDVEDKDKKYMILRMESGNYVRGTGVKDGDMDSADINNHFVIMDGIDYKSNNATQRLLYIEV